MLADLTEEQWLGWIDYFNHDPWNERRSDARSAVNAVWSLAPYIEQGTGLPGFDGPEYSERREDDLAASWARLKETAEKYNGKLNRKTSDSPNR